MTEVTRIACPGCRSPLRFEPEALDFPANCGACDCRFSAGVYVRIACPNCHSGSRIRDDYRGQRVRCARCHHDFLADEGIPPGGGGRLLIARMLDTDLAEPPETVQPFLGHAREEAERKAIAPDDGRVLEAERLKARAIADRDRLADEAGLLKAVLARLVAVATVPEVPEAALLAVEGLAEDRDRLQRLAEGLKAELDLARAEVEEHRGRLALEVEERSRADARAGLEREAFSITIGRLNWAVQSAKDGEAEALWRLEEFACGLMEAESALAAERRRALEFGRVAEGLEAEAGRAEVARGFEEERRGLLAELERARLESEGRSLENERLADAVDRLLEDNQTLNETTERLMAENARMTAEVKAARAALQQDQQASRAVEALRRENERLSADLESARSEAERRQKSLVLEIQRIRNECERLASTTARNPAGTIQ